MKSFRFIAISAITLLGISACQQKEIAPEVTTEATHTVTFVAGAPETKTTATIDGNIVNYEWTAGDINRFTVYENGTKATKSEGILDNGKMTIKATFAGSTAPKSASYVAVVNKSNATQIMSAEAYDEAADILVSKAVSSFDGDKGVQLQFKREVAIAKMTLKGLDANEVVNMVTVSSTADIAGSYGVDGWESPAASSIDISSTFAMEVGDYKIVANEAGEAVVWFTCIPQDGATLTVNVEAADGDTYTKEFSRSIILTRGDVRAFGVKMVKDVVVKPWEAVELADIDETMPLVITMATTDKTYALSLTDTDDNALGTSNAPKAIEISVVNGKLSEEPGPDILWNIANNNGNLTIYPNGITDKWLYTTDTNNGVRLGDNTSNGYVWSIDATSGYLKANATAQKVRYLGVYQGEDWRAYTNTTGNTAGQTLRFYSNATDPTVPKLSVTPTSKTWESDEKDPAVFKVKTNTAGEKDWSVSPETLDWAKIDVDKDAGTITVTPKGANKTDAAYEATLTVTHAAGTLSETITLTQKKAASTGGANKTTLSNANITAVANPNSTQTTGYRNLTYHDDNGFEYSAFAIQTYHSKATMDNCYIQIKKYASNTAYYVKLPEFTGNIKSIHLVVSSSSSPMKGGGNNATIYFSSSNSTSADGDNIVSGNGASEITIDASSLNLNTGYLTSSAAVRIWEITVEYLN